MLNLPQGVHVVRSKGRDYYYFRPNRGTAYAGAPVPLGSDPKDPDFWKLIRAARGEQQTGIKAGSFKALITEFKKAPKWQGTLPKGNYADNTKENYGISLDRIEEAWGDLMVSGLTAVGIYKLRDQYASTPVQANHLVSVLRTLLAFGIPRGYAEHNPANDVKAIAILDEKNAKPWPEEAYRIVREEAPEHLRRAAFLGRITGQRRSDLVRLGKRNRDKDGLRFQIKKRRMTEHFIPLNQAELEELDSWSCSDTGPWIVSPRGKPMSGDHLAASLGRFIASRDELKDIPQLTPHGWRAMAVCDRRMLQIEHQVISAQLNMSLQQVIRYSRHVDQEQVARAGNVKREQIVSEYVKPSKAGL